MDYLASQIKIIFLFLIYSLSVGSTDEEKNTQSLYSKVQKVFIKTNKWEEKHKDLHIVVELTSSLSKVSKQLLHIQLTDDEDPYFLYSLVITESDYQQLKSLQGLLVDFYNFPNEVVRLLQECCSNDAKIPKFLLMLEEEKKSDLLESCRTYLKVVEANNFKHLCHLQLQLLPGSDGDIKKLMLSKIKSLKDVISKNEKYVAQLNSQLNSLSTQLESKSEELIKLKQQWNDDRLSFKVESTREINEETEKLRKVQIEWQFKMQKERNEIEEKFLSTIKEKECELSKLRLDNQVYVDKKNNYEVTIKEQLKNIESLEKELTNTKWDLSSLRKQSSKLDSDYHEKERLVNSLRTKLAVAEQEVKDKSVLLNKLQELLNSSNDQKSRLEEVLGEKERSLQRKQISLQNISEEIVKANEIITKLQKELSVSNSKLKVRTSIALEQEKIVESNKVKISELESIITSKETHIKSLEDSETTLKRNIEELKELIAAKDKTLKDNERIIDWLNRRVNEQQSISIAPANWMPGAAPSLPTSTPFSALGSPDVFSAMKNENTPGKESSCTDGTLLDRIPNLSERLKPAIGSATPLSVAETRKSTSPASRDGKKVNSKPVGFKRVSIANQASSIPSSYFTK